MQAAPWANEQKITHRLYFVFAREAGFSFSLEIATSWTVGNLTPEKTPMQQMAAMVNEGIPVCEHPWYTQAETKQRSVYFFLYRSLGETPVVE